MFLYYRLCTKKNDDSEIVVTEKVEELRIDSDELRMGDAETQHDDSEDPTEDSTVCEEMDSCLEQAWLNGDDEAFDQVIHLVMNENINIDYQHAETKMTALIVAAARGNLTLVEQLVELGAKLDIQDPKNNRDALDWACHFNQDHVADHLQSMYCRVNLFKYLSLMRRVFVDMFFVHSFLFN